MFHDVIGAAQAGFPREQMIWGANFRMPELLAAVAGVQLRRLPELLEAMRVRKRQLKEGIAAVALEHGFEFRQLHDEEGDAAICLICYAPDAAQASRTAAALRSENIGAGTLYHPEQTDYHVYAHIGIPFWTSEPGQPSVHHGRLHNGTFSMQGTCVHGRWTGWRARCMWM